MWLGSGNGCGPNGAAMNAAATTDIATPPNGTHKPARLSPDTPAVIPPHPPHRRLHKPC